MDSDLKLYVWEGDGVLENYRSGLIVVLAHDLEEALGLIREKVSYAMGNFPPDKFRMVESPEAFYCWGSE